MLEIKNLTKIYKGGKKAVSGLNLSVEAGDIYGFIGRNGAGKTTTIKCIVGIHDFDEGEIFVDGKSVKDDPFPMALLPWGWPMSYRCICMLWPVYWFYFSVSLKQGAPYFP